MAFAQVKSVHGHKALVKKYLKNREIFKKSIIDEKIGMQRFQEEVAQPLQRPIKAEVDRQQDKLIERESNGSGTNTGRHR